MAIKMVREPSETPNINNIDDIIPMRYAYGGQNGYVIGKGTEISNTINGLNFTVNSGRLVLQGVECDIDATGVTITIDNIATKRYYTIYLEVNLGLNTATIKDKYDTATYPTIDAGDDLTENTTGVARLPLYQFTATSGIISEVNKLVESVKYTKDVEVQNAVNAINAINAVVDIDTNTYLSLQRNTDEKISLSTTDYNIGQYEVLYENLNGYIIGSTNTLLPNTNGKTFSGRDILVIAYISGSTIGSSCSGIMPTRQLIKRSNIFSCFNNNNLMHIYYELSGGTINSNGIYIKVSSIEDVASIPEITIYKILALN